MRTSPTERLGGAEHGFTVVEAMVAMLLLVVGLLATLSTFDSAVFGSHTAERGSEAAALAERELGRLLARPYAELVNCTNGGTRPQHGGTDTRDPTFHIRTGEDGSPPRLVIRRRPRIDGDESVVPGVAAAGEEFALLTTSACSVAGADGTGVVSGPIPAATDPGDRLFGAKIYRFVTWVDEPLCIVSGGPTIAGSVNVVAAAGGLVGVVLSSVNGLIGDLSASLSAQVNGELGTDTGDPLDLLCAGKRDAKRLTVAVVLPKIGNNAGLQKPVYLSTIVPDPADGLSVDLKVP